MTKENGALIDFLMRCCECDAKKTFSGHCIRDLLQGCMIGVMLQEVKVLLRYLGEKSSNMRREPARNSQFYINFTSQDKHENIE